MTERFDCDVAIVGAGPVGVTLAALLGQQGLSVFTGETSHEVYPLPRAAHFDHEVMRVFQQLGLVDAIAGAITPADRYVFQNAAGDVLLDFRLDQPAETGWKGYMMHQPGIERAIRGRLAGDANVRFVTGVAFQRFANDAEGVTSKWANDNGEVEVRSRYLVGCDGAWSPVREASGAKLQDLAFDETWLVLDIEVAADNKLPTINTQYCDPQRPTTYVIMGNSRRRFEFMLKPGETTETMLSDAAIAHLLAPWDTHGLVHVERKAVYRFHALIADRWRHERVLIAGDAAHQMPPFAGQGMCSGIRDAAALAWRLPLAAASADPAHLLDSYQAERDPHVRTITDAAIATGRVVCTLDPAMAAGRDEQMLAAKAAGAPAPDISSPPLAVVFGLPATRRAGERFIQPSVTAANGTVSRLDDILGPRAWLIASGGEIPAINPALGILGFRLDDSRLAGFAAPIEAWLAEAKAPAVLVRADRYIFGTGPAADLLTAFATQAGLPA